MNECYEFDGIEYDSEADVLEAMQEAEFAALAIVRSEPEAPEPDDNVIRPEPASWAPAPVADTEIDLTRCAAAYLDTEEGVGDLFLDAVGALARPLGGDTSPQWAAWDIEANRWTEAAPITVYGTLWTRSVGEIVAQAVRDAEAAAEDDGDESVKAARALQRRVQGRTFVMNSLSMARARCGSNAQITEFDQAPHAVQVVGDDGRAAMLEFRKGARRTVRPSHPDDMAMYSTGISYDPNATHAVVDDFERKHLPDPELRRFTWKVLGYAALTGGNPSNLFVLLKGAGSTGKTFAAEATNRAVGDYATAIEATKLFGKQNGRETKPELVDALRRRFVFASELGRTTEIDASTLKNLTGGDTVTGRALYSNVMVKGVPMFTPVIATNRLPTIVGADAPTVRKRLLVIPFDHQHEDTADKDLTIYDDPEFRRAWFARLAEGFQDYLETGIDLTDEASLPAEVVALRAEITEELDPFTAWCDRVFVVDPEAPKDQRVTSAQATALWNAYQAARLDELGAEHRLTGRAFGRRMTERYGPTERERGQSARSYNKSPIVFRKSKDREIAIRLTQKESE